MRIHDLKIFLAVARHKNFSRAAQEMNCVQPNISSRIKYLENRFGCELFHRGKGQVSPTGAGHTLLKFAKCIVHTEAELHSTLNGPVKASGRLTLGTLESLAAIQLPRLLTQYHELQPQVCLELKTGSVELNAQRLLSGEVDLALLTQPLSAPDFESMKLYEEPLVMVVPKGVSLEAFPETLSVLAFKNGCSFRAKVEQWLVWAGLNSRPTLEMGSLDSILACVRVGMGMSVLPQRCVSTATERHGYSFLPLPDDLRTMTTWLVSRRDYHWPLSACQFRQLCTLN